MNIISKLNEKKWFIWIVNHPKKVYTYSMIFLIASFIGTMTYEIIYLKSDDSNLIIVPTMSYTKSNKVQEDVKQNTAHMEKIVNELKSFQEKNDRQQLTKEDSLRIDYLYNQYQQLKNGY